MLRGPALLDYLIFFTPNCQFRIMVYIHAYPIIIDNNIAMINRCGGHIEEAASIPEEQVREAVRGAVCTVNIASGGWLVLTAVIRKMLYENPGNFDPRKYLGPARDELVQEYMPVSCPVSPPPARGRHPSRSEYRILLWPQGSAPSGPCGQSCQRGSYVFQP